jgi:hypothetical protein
MWVLLLVLGAIFFLSVQAEAKYHHHNKPLTNQVVSGRPTAWCGWWMRHNNGRGDPGPAFNLARKWVAWGHAAVPQPGAIVVYPHHVVRVEAVLGGGRVLATSGNDGHAVRTRVRSLRGAVAVRV